MKRTLLLLPFITCSLLGSAHAVQPQSVITDSNGVTAVTALQEASTPPAADAKMGKVLPGMVTIGDKSPAFRPCKKDKKARKKDKMEVTVVIGHTVDNYLSTLATVHSLQRF